MDFLQKNLKVVMLLNGLGDLGMLLVPQISEDLKNLVGPLVSTLGANSEAAKELSRIMGHFFFMHGIVRIITALNLDNATVRQLGAISYASEMGLVLPALLSGNPNYDLKRCLALFVLPSLPLVTLLNYKNKKSDDKKKK